MKKRCRHQVGGDQGGVQYVKQQNRDTAVERWLREDVAPAYDAMKADSDAGRPGCRRVCSRPGSPPGTTERQGLKHRSVSLMSSKSYLLVRTL